MRVAIRPNNDKALFRQFAQRRGPSGGHSTVPVRVLGGSGSFVSTLGLQYAFWWVIEAIQVPDWIGYRWLIERYGLTVTQALPVETAVGRTRSTLRDGNTERRTVQEPLRPDDRR
jgi:hypothetical protein